MQLLVGGDGAVFEDFQDGDVAQRRIVAADQSKAEALTLLTRQCNLEDAAGGRPEGRGRGKSRLPGIMTDRNLTSPRTWLSQSYKRISNVKNAFATSQMLNFDKQFCNMANAFAA